MDLALTHALALINPCSILIKHLANLFCWVYYPICHLSNRSWTALLKERISMHWRRANNISDSKRCSEESSSINTPPKEWRRTNKSYRKTLDRCSGNPQQSSEPLSLLTSSTLSSARTRKPSTHYSHSTPYQTQIPSPPS